LEDGLEVVEPIGTGTEDTQIEIDLRERREADGSH